MDGRAFVHAEDAESLHALRTLQHFTLQARAFVGGLETASAEACDVKKNIRQTVVRNDEPITLGCIEPLDGPGNFKNFEPSLVHQIWTAFKWLLEVRKARTLSIPRHIVHPATASYVTILLPTAASRTANPEEPSSGSATPNAPVRSERNITSVRIHASAIFRARPLDAVHSRTLILLQ